MDYLTPLEVASVCTNGAALMLLAGVFYTTGIYRERGRFDDRLFCYMILVDAVIAVCDGVAYFVDEHTFPFARELAIISNTVLLFSVTLFGAMYIALVHYRTYRQEELTRKLIRILVAVEAVILVANLLNIPFGFFWVVSKENLFSYRPFMPVLDTVIHGGFIMVGLIALIAKKRYAAAKYIPAELLLFLSIPDMAADYYVEISIYAIIRAITLCYLHMAILDEEFYARGGLRHGIE